MEKARTKIIFTISMKSVKYIILYKRIGLAPGTRKYFGDGYSMPIVSISVNGEVLLSFDEGFENLMKLY